jgi:DNA-binding beta-propeller fold protein YncE
VAPRGSVTVFATSTSEGLAFDAAGNLFVANFYNNTIEEFAPNGVGTVFASTGLNEPAGLALATTSCWPSRQTAISGPSPAACTWPRAL